MKRHSRIDAMQLQTRLTAGGSNDGHRRQLQAHNPFRPQHSRGSRLAVTFAWSLNIQFETRAISRSSLICFVNSDAKLDQDEAKC